MSSLLSAYRPGESGTVTAVAPGEISAKLVEMGIYAGKKVRVVLKAPFGDPIAVDVEGYLLSLRLDEAKLISLLRD
jgi:ferrous iron transport protein A